MGQEDAREPEPVHMPGHQRMREQSLRRGGDQGHALGGRGVVEGKEPERIDAGGEAALWVIGHADVVAVLRRAVAVLGEPGVGQLPRGEPAARVVHGVADEQGEPLPVAVEVDGRAGSGGPDAGQVARGRLARHHARQLRE